MVAHLHIFNAVTQAKTNMMGNYVIEFITLASFIGLSEEKYIE